LVPREKYLYEWPPLPPSDNSPEEFVNGKGINRNGVGGTGTPAVCEPFSECLTIRPEAQAAIQANSGYR